MLMTAADSRVREDTVSYDAGPDGRLTIISDRPKIAEDIADDILMAGGTVHFRLTSADVLRDPGRLLLTDGVIIDIPGEDADTLQLLGELRNLCADSPRKIAMMTQLACLDIIYAALLDLEPHILIGDSRAERIVTLAHMILPTKQAGHAPRDGDYSNELQNITAQVSLIAKRLAELSKDGQEPGGGPLLGDRVIDYAAEVQDRGPNLTSSHLADSPGGRRFRLEPDQVRAVIRARRLRDRYFDASLFADPAWDMLLDMTAAHLEQLEVSVSSLCIASCVPPTTALRWIKVMTDAGLFERHADEQDGRRVYMRLSQSCLGAMQDYFGALHAQKMAVL